MKNYGEIIAPLTQLLQKNAFGWNELATSAFHDLKDAMAKIPVLALSDFTKTFVVETDTLGIGLEAELMQDKHLIAYFSQKLSEKLEQSLFMREN